MELEKERSAKNMGEKGGIEQPGISQTHWATT